LLSATLFLSRNKVDDGWLSKNNKSFTLYYTQSSKNDVSEYKKLIIEGVASTENFFHTSYLNKFEVYIHPRRGSLDSTWRKDWKMPEFKSDCWMVASGVAKKKMT
jgi:hypothetical protein